VKVYFKKYPNHTTCKYWKPEFNNYKDIYIMPALGSFSCSECNQLIKLKYKDDDKSYLICKQYNFHSREKKLKRLIKDENRYR